MDVSPFVLENMTLHDVEVFTVEDNLRNTEAENQISFIIKPREKKPIVVPLQSTELKIRIDGKEHFINIGSIGKRLIPNSEYIVDCEVQKLFKVIVIMNCVVFKN